MARKFSSLLLTLPLLIAGCSFVPQYQRPEVELPPGWLGTQETSQQNNQIKEWWATYQSEALQQYVQQALEKNWDIQAGIQRIEQARAQIKIVSGALWPSLSINTSAGRTILNAPNQFQQNTNSFGAGATVGYELDLWGRNRARRDSAQAEATATEFDTKALALTISAETARTYATILALDDRISIARQNQENAKQVLSIIESRFDAGSASALERAQQRSAMASVEAVISELLRQRSSTVNALAVLIGKPAQLVDVAPASISSLTLPQVTPSVPSDLLERRPDILRAESFLIAANYDVGAARADFFPRIQLGLSAGLDADTFSGPYSALYGLTSGIATPLFQGETLQGELERSKARKNELVANYQQTILLSFQEVEDALAALSRGKDRTAFLATAAKEAQVAYDLSRQQYQSGSVDYLSLLETQRTLFQTQDSSIQGSLDLLLGSIDLFRALAGGWE